jgi:hypothetical protein
VVFVVWFLEILLVIKNKNGAGLIFKVALVLKDLNAIWNQTKMLIQNVHMHLKMFLPGPSGFLV